MENVNRFEGYKRILTGVVVLLSVDILWVVSAEISEYIFHNEHFDKPFFTTYLKTSMFTLYLLGICFIRRWQYQFFDMFKKNDSSKLYKEIKRVSGFHKSKTLVASEDMSRCSSPISENHFSSEHYENMTEDGSSNEDDINSSQKVSFSDTRQVRSLSESHSDAQTLARMSQQSFEALKSLLSEVHSRYPLKKTLILSLYVAVLWLLATLMYQEALSQTSAAVTNILSSSSSIFTLLLASFFPSSAADRLTLSKFIAVCVSIGGIFLICWTDPNREKASINLGDLYSLLGAMIYSTYLILIKRKVKDETLDIPLFFGVLGFFGLILFWPVFFLLHYTGIETFELPHDKETWIMLVVNAVVGTVLSEFLWLWGCFLTSSLMATLSLGLVIPLTMIWDITFNHIRFSGLFFVGIIPVTFSFISVTILTHRTEWDPVKDFFCFLCGRKSVQSDSKGLEEEERSLLKKEEFQSSESISSKSSVDSLVHK